MQRIPSMTEDQTARAMLDALFEEYRALYALASYRFAALDRRAPIAAATLAGSLASASVVPGDAEIVVLVGVPLALVWVVRTTVNHARSCEDALRAIERIEKLVNELLGAEVLSYQSRHPSRVRHVGGRTSSETITAVAFTAVLMVAGCAYLFVRSPYDRGPQLVAYGALLLAVLASVGWSVMRIRRYRPPDAE